MTIMDVCKKYEKVIKEAVEDMRNVETSYTFPKLRSTYTVHYTYIVLIKFKTMILDSVICIGKRIPLSEYERIDELNFDKCDLNVARDEWMSILATHIPESLQDGIRSIWENNTTVRKWVETSTKVLDMIYPYLSKEEKEVLLNISSKYRKILSGESIYDLIEEKGSC